MDENKTEIMRPGILVILKTRVSGGVRYEKIPGETNEDGTVVSWETTRYMDDPAERRRATELIGQAAGPIAKLCKRTKFALWCAVEDEEELDRLITASRLMVAAWNRKSKHTTVHVSAIKGRIAENDAEAMRAIVDEISELMEQMDRGFELDDAEMVRKACGQLKVSSQMLTPAEAGRAEDVIQAARSGARALTKRAGDKADRVLSAIIQVEREKVDKARSAFLEVAEAVIESLPTEDSRSADLEVV